MLDEDPRMNAHESQSVLWFYPPKEDKMKAENDASRVSNMERGRPSFQSLLNARAPTPGHSYLRLWRKCRPLSAPRVRLRTLIRTSYEFKNAMMNVPTVARAASALRNFSIW